MSDDEFAASRITHTEDIADLMDALAAAQGEFTPVLKATENLYFKSRYADLGIARSWWLPAWRGCSPVPRC